MPGQLTVRNVSGPLSGAPSTINDNLVAYWKLEEATGAQRNDSIGNSHFADLETVTQAAGKVNNCANFERDNNERLETPDDADINLDGDVSFFVSLWVRLESKPGAGGNEMAAFNKLQWNGAFLTGAVTIGWTLAADRLRCLVSDSGAGILNTNVNADLLGSPALATWYHIIGEYDSPNSTVRIFVNNNAGNSAAVAHAVGDTASTPLALGAFTFMLGGRDHMWDGDIDEVGLWRGRISTAAERTYLYNSGNGTTYPFT